MSPIPDGNLEGQQLLRNRVIAALEYGHESESVEVKESAPWEVLKYKIAKTVMAMSNQRDGGLLIIGVAEGKTGWEFSGVSSEHLATYDADDIVDFINRFASPALRPTIVRVTRDVDYVAIDIHEFRETPTVCKREGLNLREGDVYVRSAGKPATTRIMHAGMMHELLELAAEKRARRMIEVSKRLGLEMHSGPSAYEKEREGL
ncbi:MAG TPA: ATP-binding protein [Candidatus Krumholzibacteria bacterium]|nr:ATP-binding protein [Candidatus Krumholzibacteria bacterium]